MNPRCSSLIALVPAALVALVLSGGSAATAQTDGDSAPGPPIVEVLDRGDTPRTELRYTIPAGTEQTMTMRTYTKITQQTGDDVQSGGTPNVIFTIDANTSEVDAVGNLTVDYVYSKIEVGDNGPRDVAERTRDALEPLIGVTGKIEITPTGSLVSSTIDVPPDVEPSLEQLIDQLNSQASQLTVPFPDEAVGDGARWRATSEAEVNGLTFRQTSTYTIERERSGRVTLEIVLTQRAARQTFTPPGSTESFTLLSSRGEGSGETILDPSRAVLPVGGSTDIQVRQRLRSDDQVLRQTTQTSLFINENR